MVIISWDTLPGKRYTLLNSPILTSDSWLATDVPQYGEGQPIAITVTLNQDGGIPPDRYFWRVAIDDVDSDDDGLADHEEFLLGLNPSAGQTYPEITDLWIGTYFPNTASAFDPNHAPHANGLTYQQMHDLGLNPNQEVAIGPMNFAFSEDLNSAGIVKSFRDPNPPESPEPHDPYSSLYHPSDLYAQGSVPGWQAAIGEFIEIWDENKEARHPDDPPPAPSPYVELQAHFGAKGIKQQFNMLPGTTLSFILQYKGRYDGYNVSNPFKLQVEGAHELLVNGQHVQIEQSVKEKVFMADDEWGKYSAWHYAVVTINTDVETTTLAQTTLTLIPENTDEAITHGGFVVLRPVALKVDYDRDGKDDILGDIGDSVVDNKPFQFWVNNDHDVGDDAAADDDPETSSNVTNRISCLRDLEDYVRLHVDLSAIKDLVKDGTVKVGFRFVNVEPNGGLPGIGVYLAADTQDGKDEYLFDETAAQAQLAGDFKNRVADVFSLYETWLDNTAVQSMNDEGHLHLIFDGSSEGSGNLVLLLKWPNQDSVEVVKIPMMIRKVRDMYEHWTAGDHNSASFSMPPTQPEKTSDSGSYDQTSLEEEDVIVFVHGWRMRPWERRNFADTSYKRLWHQGYKGRFFHFSWPTEYTDRSPGWPYEPLDKDNYADSEEKAYWSGAITLKAFLDTLNTTYPGKVRLFAHSMGGIVASEALLRGASLHTYAACQTAVAAHSYDAAAAARPATALNLGSWDTPEVYADYPPTGLPYYEGIVGHVFNFHNEVDDALVGWESGQDLKPNNGVGLSPAENYHCDDFDETANTGLFNYDEGILYPQRDLLLPLNRYEIFAHCAEARSFAAGARNVGSVRANFDIRRDFSDPAYAFGPNREGHSGQFRGTNMIRHEFWKTLLGPSCFAVKTSRDN